MTSLLRSLTGANPVSAERNDAMSLGDWASYLGSTYPVLATGGTQGQKGENIAQSFPGFVSAYQSNPVVFACMAARSLLFSEARFQFRRLRFGRPGDMYGTQALGLLERPWDGGSTADLLTKAITDADLAGNFYAVRRANTLQRLRPDWVTIVLGSRSGSEYDLEKIGYSYQPGGPGSGEDPVALGCNEVAHFAPYQDPLAKYRGMSWLGTITEEIVADQATTVHKRNFFENGAQLGYVVTLDKDMNAEKFGRWVDAFKAGHEGSLNAYKTLFLAGGADIKTVGADLKQADFKQIQGAGETRICAAARVPAIIVGVSEGLESATYSNYGQARRAFADLTMRPMWRNIAHTLERVVQTPSDSELWYDDRDISFLQEDMKDEAEIQATQATAINSLVTAGYTPDSVMKAVTAGDLTILVHSGLFSVQLQPAGSQSAEPMNGNGQPAGLPA